MNVNSFQRSLLTAAALLVTGLIAVRSDSGPPFVSAPPATPKYAMQVTGAKHVVGIWRTRAYTTNFPTSEWVISFPVALDLPRQSGAMTSMTPAGEFLKEASPAQRPILSLDVQAVNGVTPQSVSTAVRYEATLYARRMVSGPAAAALAPAPPLDARELAIYSAASPTLDFNSNTFQTWLDNHTLRRQANEDEVDFARRVYSTMLGTYRYLDGVDLDSVSKICNLADLDCDTMSAVFTATMRANRIPARVVFAWPAATRHPDAKGLISGHAMAEFFAPGAGWVPIDVSRGRVARTAGIDPARFFGEDDGTHLVAQVDPDYMVKSPLGTRRVTSMHPGPTVWFREKKADARIQPQTRDVTVTNLQIRR